VVKHFFNSLQGYSRCPRFIQFESRAERGKTDRPFLFIFLTVSFVLIFSPMIVGIDLGTTNSLIGVMESGFPILLANRDGERLTPSVVHFPVAGAPLVGAPARRVRALDPENTVYSIKRFMGRRSGEEAADVPYQLTGRPGAPVRVAIRDREYSPEQISAFILAHLKQQAENLLETPITRAVVTVPAYFNDAQRAATKAAGELAGLTVERIINEPTAAALAYGLQRLGEHSKVAVYDFGGGTFDISILELSGGVFQVLSTNGDTRLGGDDIDQAIVSHCRLPVADYRLREVAIEAKHRLSTEEEVRIDLPFVEGVASQVFTLTRADLDRIARPVVERTRERCLRSLADARLTPADLDAVILVGGQTRMPLIRQFVSELFQREPDTSQNPDEAVALGATIQAGILSGAVQNVVLLDVTPLSLGIETFGGLMNVIIPRNTTIPAKAGEMFTNAMAGQQSMLIRVLQGEREMARDNWELGSFDLAFEPAPKAQARVGVQFEIDANGILHVLARDVKTGIEKIIEIKSAVDVSDEAVEEMIAASVEHAFDDMSERVFTEARLKAVEMLPAVRAALDQLGDAVGAPSRESIAGLMAEVESALESREVQRLKKANAALDEGTQLIATLLVERAMEESLRRKGVL
jgi:molecular chaperone DnaK